MLDTIRQKLHGIVVWIIIIVIGLAFIGLSDFFISNGDNRVAVKVNGNKITWYEVEEAQQRMMRQYGDKVDIKALKEQVRTFLARRMILLDGAEKLGFKVGDDQVYETLLQFPEFKVDGKFSKDRYLQILRDAGYTDSGFRSELAEGVLLGQLERGLTQSSFILSDEFYRLIELLEQKRDIGYTTISRKKFKAGISPSKEEINAYYNQHQSAFVRPEQVSLEYVQLNLDNLAKDIVIDEEEQKAYYEEHKDSYGAPDRVRARHLLIALPEGASEAENAKAQDSIKEIQSKLAQGADFAELAKEYSEDVESGKKGGDLGWFTKGQMVPEFEKAVFAMQDANSISEPVRTPFGYHIIQLIEHKQAETRAYNEVALLIKEQLQKEKAQTLFHDKGEQLAKLAFERPKEINSIAQDLGLKVETTEYFGKQGGKEKLTQAPEVIQTAFSDALLKQGNNSEPIKMGENKLVVIRLKEYQPAKQLTLAEVEKQISDSIINERAAFKMRDAAETLSKQLQNGENPETLAKEKDFKWITKKDVGRTDDKLDKQILLAAFQTPKPEGNSPSVKIMSLPNGDMLILSVNDIHEGDNSKLDEKMRKAYKQNLAEAFGQFEFSLYVNKILQQAKVEFTKS